MSEMSSPLRESKLLDVKKPAETRNGRPARYLGTLANNTDDPLVYAVSTPCGESVVRVSWEGRASSIRITADDIFNTPNTRWSAFISHQYENRSIFVVSYTNLGFPTQERLDEYIKKHFPKYEVIEYIKVEY